SRPARSPRSPSSPARWPRRPRELSWPRSMAYRLLALDLDGTLLRRDHTVDPRDVAAIAELQAAGVTVTIATGRLQSGATGAARACAIEGTIACVEGSHLVELSTNTTLAHYPMDPAATEI